jgi:membrane-bound lytic murein transglycosylase B
VLKVLIAAGAIALVVPQQAPQQAPPPAAQTPSFEDFMAGVRAEARERGISPATIDLALSGLEPLPVVVTRDRAQPESTQSLDEYLAQRLTPRRIATGREMLATHAGLLARIEQAYGIAAPVMVAVWGLESNFGAFTGSYPTIAALATLAWDARRQLFRDELFIALKILDEGRVRPEDLKGSWAGAMGQPQFMPSSYARHAADFDADGRADIWTSLPDVFASMANYLRNSGWRKGERWGREVRVAKAAMGRVDRTVPMRTSGCRAERSMTVGRPLTEWTKIGVTLAGGRPLPAADASASLVRGQSRHFLVYRNYEALLAYNCSHAYAVAVGLLSERIAAR